MNTYVQAGVSGVMIGGLYAIMALGLSLTWGLLKVINLAHFALILGSAYVDLPVHDVHRLSTRCSRSLVVVPALFVIGVAIQWVIERFEVDEFNSLLLSFGLFIIAIRLVNNIWSADFRRSTTREPLRDARRSSSATSRSRCPLLMALGAALVFAVATYVVLRHTYFGKALRALAYDREIAAAFGVDHRRIGMLDRRASASAMGGVAGMLIGINQAVFPQLAYEWVGIVFAVVILGGIGNLLGAVAAGILIGLVTSDGRRRVDAARARRSSSSSRLILALLFRPNGLFGRLGLISDRRSSRPSWLAIARRAALFVPNLQNATGFPVFYLVYLYFVFFWIAQSTSWNILSGYTGLLQLRPGRVLRPRRLHGRRPRHAARASTTS